MARPLSATSPTPRGFLSASCSLGKQTPVKEANTRAIHVVRPFLPKDCASPPASSVKALHFAPMNANSAALTAHAAKRLGRLGRALFFCAAKCRCAEGKTQKRKG